ncbi:MAG: c-type cytochrome [Nitrospirales bacterium]
MLSMFRVMHSTSVFVLRSVFLTTAFGFALSPLAIAETGDSEAGQRIYEESCEHCHGYAGNGQGQMTEYLTPPPAKLTSESTQSKTDAQLEEIILKGRPGTAMVGFEGALNATQMAGLLTYLRSLKP